MRPERALAAEFARPALIGNRKKEGDEDRKSSLSGLPSKSTRSVRRTARESVLYVAQMEGGNADSRKVANPDISQGAQPKCKAVAQRSEAIRILEIRAPRKPETRRSPPDMLG